MAKSAVIFPGISFGKLVGRLVCRLVEFRKKIPEENSGPNRHGIINRTNFPNRHIIALHYITFAGEKLLSQAIDKFKYKLIFEIFYDFNICFVVIDKMKLILILVCFKLILNVTVALQTDQTSKLDIVVDEDDMIQRKWKSMMLKTHELTRKFVSRNGLEIKEKFNEMNVTEKCMKSVMKIFDGIMNLEDWAIES